MRNKKLRGLWLIIDRALSHSLLKQVGILLVVLFVVFWLSFGLLELSGAEWQKVCDEKGVSRWLFPLYLLIDTNALNNIYIVSHSSTHPNSWTLIASIVVYLMGVVIFSGMIISVMTNAIARRVRYHQGGHIHYLKSGHYIIMGYDDIVTSFITHIFNKDKKAYVLILTSAEAVDIREKLRKSFSEKLMKRIIINYGHRISTETYKDVHLEAAEQIYIVGNHHKSAHDAINVECVDSICLYLSNPKIKEKPSRITCVFKDLDTYTAFKNSEIFCNVVGMGIEFVPYNVYSGWAKQVFIKQQYKDFDHPNIEPYIYPAVYGKGITPDDDKFVHLVFVGTTNFAVAFAMEAAYVLHFPNADKAKTKITFIDINADKEKDEFIVRNRHFFELQPFTYYDLTNEDEKKKEKQGVRDEYVTFKNAPQFLDVEFEFIKGNMFSKKVQDLIEKCAYEHNEKQCLSIFLALSDQRQNFVMSMNMPDSVYDNAVPVFIRQDRSDNFITNLRNGMFAQNIKVNYSSIIEGGLKRVQHNVRYSNIYPFGMNETAYCADNHSLKRAKLINFLYATANYETYKFRGIMEFNAFPDEKIWAEADSYWKKLSVALKWSNLYNAYTIRTKLASLRAMRGLDFDDKSHDYQPLSEEEVEVMAKVEHNRWNVEKLLMGYRKAKEDEDQYVHGKFANELRQNKNLFIHHDIRPFEELNDIQELDREFSRYIPWIMRMTEKQHKDKQQ